MNKAIIAMDKSGSFRVYLAVTTGMVEQARQIHDTTPLATAALGRVLTAAGLTGVARADVMWGPVEKAAVAAAYLLPAALVAAVIAVTVYLLRKFRKRK